MKRVLTIATALFRAGAMAFGQTYKSGWVHKGIFPPNGKAEKDSLHTGNVHGLAVSPDGRVWIQNYGVYSRHSILIPNYLHKTTPTDSIAPRWTAVRALYAYNPDGTPAPFSPIKIVHLIVTVSSFDAKQQFYQEDCRRRRQSELESSHPGGSDGGRPTVWGQMCPCDRRGAGSDSGLGPRVRRLLQGNPPVDDDRADVSCRDPEDRQGRDAPANHRLARGGGNRGATASPRVHRAGTRATPARVSDSLPTRRRQPGRIRRRTSPRPECDRRPNRHRRESARRARQRGRRDVERARHGARPSKRASLTTLLGPAPSPIARVRRKYRFQMLLLSPKRETLRVLALEARKAVEDKFRNKVQVIIDVDPVNLM